MTISFQTPGWHVAYTDVRAEDGAQAGIEAVGFECLLLKEKLSRKVIRGRLRDDLTRPLFSRYLFVRFNPYREEWQRIEHVDGVQSVIKNGDMPSRVPDAWITAMRKAERYGLFDRTKQAPQPFELNEVVRVSDGPFSGFNGKVVELIHKLKSSTAKKRVKVLLDFMNRAMVIELPVSDLEKL